MKKTDTTEIFHVIKNKLIDSQQCGRYQADSIAEDIRSSMYNNKRFITGYNRMFIKKNGPLGFIVNFNCEFIFPDTDDKVTARFFYKSEFKNHQLHIRKQFRNIDWPIGSKAGLSGITNTLTPV